MSSLVVWMIAIMISIVLLVLSAAASAHYVHMMVAAVMAVVLAGSALIEARRLRAEGASDALVASSNAHFMGLVWAWVAISLIVTYNFVLHWREWMSFAAASAVAASICLYFSMAMKQEAAKGTYDPVLKKIGRILTIVQVAGMAIAVVGLIVDGKMTRFLNPRYTDWAANNVFFFGAIALFVIGVHALLSQPSEREPRPAH